MKRTRIFWAIVVGCALAIAGCGDSKDDSLDQALGNGGDVCATLCETCGGGQADCAQGCDQGIGMISGELNGCPDQLNAVASCLGANGCEGDTCDAQWNAWITCLITQNL